MYIYLLRCQKVLQDLDGPVWRQKLPAMSAMPGTKPHFTPHHFTPHKHHHKGNKKHHHDHHGNNHHGNEHGEHGHHGDKGEAKENSKGKNLSVAEKLKEFNVQKDRGNELVKKVSCGLFNILLKYHFLYSGVLIFAFSSFCCTQYDIPGKNFKAL
jgi:hypothetical protein